MASTQGEPGPTATPATPAPPAPPATPAAPPRSAQEPVRHTRTWFKEAVGCLFAVVLLSGCALGIWRAVALGADGTAAGTFVATAGGLLATSVLSFNRWTLRPAYAVTALLLAAVTTFFVGRWGQEYFADQPVDVTGQIAWPTDPAQPTTTATARLGVPKQLNRLDISVVLEDLHPDAGDCSDSTFSVRRMGDIRPAERAAGAPPGTKAHGGDAVTVRIPPNAKQVDLLLTVAPAPGCEVTAYIQLARFYHA
ncbi:hypothetical protein ACFW1A_08040 [Kitasatospora sp. NPDC058965]|uniref:hypothetical protein n=1 Tax=Kitasatospora sp. NPDC058965 TaxID=3346682 RepID=UPI003685C8F6